MKIGFICQKERKIWDYAIKLVILNYEKNIFFESVS
jgi:hypothetical protein